MKVKVECQHKIYLPSIGMYVGCGYCPVCRSKKSNEWYVRLYNEYIHSESSIFFTLTYNDQNVPFKEISFYLHPTGRIIDLPKSFNPRDYQNYPRIERAVLPTFEPYDIKCFLKRLRSDLSYKYEKFGATPPSIKYFIIGEYCPTSLRPHYHGIFYGLPKENIGFIERNWQKGFVTNGSIVNTAALRYVSKYCTQSTILPETHRLKSMRFRTQCSHYIGLYYINNQEVVDYHKNTLNTTVLIDGIKYAMPRYYRDKIFDDNDKELIRKNAEEAAKNYDKWYKEKFIDTGYDTPNRTRSKEVYNDFIKKVKKKVTTSLNSDESLQLNKGESTQKK